MAKVNGDGQIGMDERVVENEELERALETRLRRQDTLAEVRKSFKTAHEAVVELLKEAGLADGEAIRVGRFRITKRFVEGGHREFDTADRSQLGFELVV
jgi:biopolymer transport protein ExbD